MGIGSTIKSARFKRGLTRIELAARVHRASSWIVDIERDRGSLSPAEVVDLASALQLDAVQLLTDCIRSNQLSVSGFEAAQFAEAFDTEQYAYDRLARNDAPEVAPRSYAEIERCATDWASCVATRDVRRGRAVDLVGCLEAFSERFEEREGQLLRFDTAYGDAPEGSVQLVDGSVVVKLRSDVWDRVRSHEPRARFTLAHELGHAAQHAKDLRAHTVMFRDEMVTPVMRANVPIYRSAEYQANAWASCFLLSTPALDVYFSSADDDDEDESLDVARHFQVSQRAAEYRLNKYYRLAASRQKERL